MATTPEGPETKDRPPLAATPFVGRRPELKALATALATPPTMVLINGEAGVGKSRLLREFLGTVDGALVAECLPVPEPYTLGPLVDALRQATDRIAGLRLTGLAGALRPLFPEWGADLPPMPAPAEDATASRHRVFRAFAELLAGLDVRVLVVEDAHWADGATLELLLYLARRAGPRPGLVVTYRPEDLPVDSLLLSLSAQLPKGALRLGLAPLTSEETATLVSSMLSGGRVSAGFAEFLYTRTEGLPLAVEESLRLMYDRGDLIRRGNRWARRRLDRIDVPPSVRDAVLERARRLGPDTWTLLGAVAVLVEPARTKALREVSGLPADRATAALVRAFAAGLLVEDGRGLVSFRHLLAGRAIYEAVPAPERRVMHGRAGRTLDGPSSQLARHFKEAGDTVEWLRYGEQAADAALASGDEATAGALLYDLLTGADLAAGDLATLMDRLPLTALRGAGHHEQLISTLRSALSGRDLPAPDEAILRYQLGRVLFSGDENVAAYVEMKAALPGLPDDSVALVRALTLLARRGTAAPVSQRLAWLRRAAAVPVGPISTGARLRLTVDRIGVLLHLGEEDGWRQAALLPRTASTSEERLQLARAALNTGDAAMDWGRYPDSRDRLERALGLADEHGYERLREEVRATLAHLDWLTGAWDGLAERAAALAADEDLAPLARLEALTVVAHLHAVRGEFEPAQDCLVRALDGARRRGAVEYVLEPAATLAALRLEQGLIEEALAITGESLDWVSSEGLWLYGAEIVPIRVRALLASGRPDDAAALVEAFADGLRGRDLPAGAASLDFCRAHLAELSRDGRAAGLFAQAAAAWQALPRPYYAALARECLGASLLTDGDADGGAHLSEALSAFTELGASADADRVAHALRGHGFAVPRAWRGGRRGYGDRLSPRELEVVRLVATGRTNREIGKVLSRSPETVASQLKSAMRKLGTSSRTALTARVIDDGLIERH